MLNKINVSSFITGFIFSIGLGISGMMNKDKVLGFLDLTGKWDPSLAFVMIGGIAVTFVSYYFIFKMKKPLFSEKFDVPKNRKLDRNLLLGAFLFGTGWGIGGLCPGPAIANLASFNPNIFIFVASMLVGFVLQQNVKVFKTKENKSQIKREVIEPCVVD